MSGRGNPSSGRQVSDLRPPMTTNVSAPEPTAGERCGGSNCPGASCRDTGPYPYPATPADDDASEPLTEALLSVRVKVEGFGRLYADDAGTMPLWSDDDPDMHAVRDALLPWLAAREAAAATKARADERERIAQAIEALPGPENVGIGHWRNEDARHGYLLGIEEAAANARGDA